MDIVLATRNKKKIEEMKKIMREAISGADINILVPDDFPQCREVEEDGKTFEENAVKKARYISECTGLPAIADDSGLEADALNGAPGVFSARFAGEDADDTANNEKLLIEMKDVSRERRSARFVCCMALAVKGAVRTFFGRVEGRIGTQMRGTKGFGYDPLFYPEGHDRTFAEMSDDEKNALSHRGKALRELQRYIGEKGLAL
ncbi:MAG: XTP/dITP diphosphatase [Nitrospirae bacterium]|nr:XTP/dITP diphosphatase [Nitrospirota bacterium]